MPLTPLQQGLLFHAGTAQGGDDVYAVQLDITITGALDAAAAARGGAHGDHPPSAIWWPGSANSSTSRCRSSRPIPRCPGAMSSWTPKTVDVEEQVQAVCAAERAAVCDLADQPAFRAALIRTGPDRHRLVLTNHHIVIDGWSLPILLGEIFAGYYRQPLPPAGAVSQVCRAGWPSGTWMPPARPGGRCWPGLTPRPWWVRRAGWGWGARGVASHRVSEQTTRALSELARCASHHRQHGAAGRLGAAAVRVDRPA